MKRMKRTRVRGPSPAAFAPLAAAAALAGIGPVTHDLSWHTIDGGGGASAGATLVMSGTIGQAEAGVMSAGSLTLTGGFWPVAVEAAPPCPEDTNDDGMVDVEDLVAVVLGWGACPAEGDCPDLNGDGLVDVEDLIRVVIGWGPCDA